MVDLEFTRKIRLFGPFSLEFTRSAEADSVEAASSALRRKTRALLGYLIADGRAYNRQLLADWFCATADDPARALRMLLSRVRTGVGAESITVERDRIRFNADVVWVDLLLFSRLLAGDLHTCALADLETAVSLTDLTPEQLIAHLHPIDRAVAHLPRVDFAQPDASRLLLGQSVTAVSTHPESTFIRAYDYKGTFLGIIQRTQTGWQAQKMFPPLS